MRDHTPVARRLCPFIPYVAVAVGMYGLRSAWLAMGLYHAGMLAAAAAWRDRSGNSGKRAPARWVLATPAVFACGGVAFYILWPLLNPDQTAISAALAGFGVSPQTWPYLAVYFCLVNSAVEEIFWRGWLQDDSRRIVLNDLLFAGYHAMVLMAFTGPLWTVPVIAACAFAGWLWRMLRSVSGALLVPILTHFVADAGIVLAVHLRAFPQ